LCTETVSEPNADTDAVVRTISLDKIIDKVQVLEEDDLNETINVNNSTTLVY
jgi:hypothetical protein